MTILLQDVANMATIYDHWYVVELVAPRIHVEKVYELSEWTEYYHELLHPEGVICNYGLIRVKP